MAEYKNLNEKRKKAIAKNAQAWVKENRVCLVSNVKPETRALFDQIHTQLTAQNLTKSREDTVVYLCRYFLDNAP